LSPSSGQNLKLEPAAAFLWNAGTIYNEKNYMVSYPPPSPLKSINLILVTEETSNPIQLVYCWMLWFHRQCYSPFRLSRAPVGFWIHGLFVCLAESKALLTQMGKSWSTATHTLFKLFVYFVCHNREISVERDIWVSHRDAGSEVLYKVVVNLELWYLII
jgi:hypothetical protein